MSSVRNADPEHVDSAARIEEAKEILARKPALRSFYERAYAAYAECLSRCPNEGIALELGSGGGFARERIPDLVTSDIHPAPGIDQVLDARRLPFPDSSLRAILMLNVFHHIPDSRQFLEEAERCLVPGGRVLIIDHHWSPWSKLLLRHAHHEPFDPSSPTWEFPSAGPMSSANTALAGIVFERDRSTFERSFPALQIAGIRPHSPLFYWLAGGMRPWSLLPAGARWIRAAAALDWFILSALGPVAASFVDIELVRQDPSTSGR